jgi:hypothetical protein
MTRNGALVVAKVFALVGLGCFLLLPQAGCENETYNGLDLVASSDDFGFIQVMGLILILASVVALFVPNRRAVSALGTVAIVCLSLMLWRLKRGAWVGEHAEIKYGAFLTGLGLLGAAVMPWLSRQPEPPPDD